MYREMYEQLVQWKNAPARKPLIVNGARQVGKTWLLLEFAKKEYDNYVYINCDNNPEIDDLFIDFDIERIIRSVSALTETHVTPGRTLIIFDEVQEAPQALTSLKYFCENARDYHVAVAGSLLGVRVHKGTGFPVGKVDEMTLYPLTFKEFLHALGRSQLVELMESGNYEELNSLAHTYKEALRQYYFVGGMPEVVHTYVTTHNIQETRAIQNKIIENYRSDFSRHIPDSLLPKVTMVWDSLPSQLAKESKKFIYGVMKKGARAKDFEDAISWLHDAGLVHKVRRVSKIASPLKFYEDMSAFKLFVNDLGLLGALAEVKPREILTGAHIFEEYKGAFTEQYVAGQLIACGLRPYYYTNKNSTAEIDFVIQGDDVWPIEVKAEENLKSKSLKSVIDKNPRLHGIRFSMSPYRQQECLTNIPLYLVQQWAQDVANS